MIDPGSLAAPNSGRFDIRSLGYWLTLAAVVALGAWLRVHGLADHSLTQDESTMLEAALGVLERGYPMIVHSDSERGMATYELVPYFIAVAVKLLGWNEWAVRLPAAFFGIGTLVLLALAARRWFNDGTSLWAAFLYAISPWAIYWGQNCFYPSQLQFFALLSVILVHNILTADRPSSGAYWLAALCLGLTYLSWEGIGLMFVVLGIMAIGLRWRQWHFLRSPAAWLALGSLGLLVVLQLVRRALNSDPYVTVGSSLANIGGPQLAMLQPTYDPLYYLERVFASEQMLVLTLFFLAGLWFVRRDWNLRFVYAFVILMEVVYSELLAVHTIRYFYSVLPLFLLGTAAASFRILDWTYNAGTAAVPVIGRSLGLVVGILILGMQAATVSDRGLRVTGLSQRFETEAFRELGSDVVRADFRAIMLELQRKYRPGDIVVLRASFLLHAYTGMKGDYGLQKITRSVVNYEPDSDRTRYSEKFLGNPVLRDLDELKDLLYKHDRVWLVAAPFGLTRNFIGKDTFEFVARNMDLEMEGHRVRLYLWERP